MYLLMVIFLFMLAVFDLYVGVSNDAVNFLNSAIGARVAKFRTIVAVAAIGVFLGATMSDGMMDIARHGIMQPQYFSFSEVMVVFLAVITTDIVLIDTFNTLGMPTSTTVSMIFNLLGASSAVAMVKMLHGGGLPYAEYINTDKVLEVILGIFLSVAIAFVFGMIIQWVVRMLFTFKYAQHLKWKIGLFGGVAVTSIVYFMVFKGMKNMPIMTPEMLDYVDSHAMTVLACSFVVFTVLMQILYILKVNVFKVIILLGTFALALAFAGNDLVNFMGVPLAGYSSYMDFMANGGDNATGYMMNSLNGPANTPIIFLIGAGAVMVFALSTSEKARNVTKTQVGLSSQQEGEEMFGSSRIARSLVRGASNISRAIGRVTPAPVQSYINRRFAPIATRDDAAYDLVRASVNLVVAALLIALGTSLKLPLSTTYVTFMVAMGASLADRAWSRESAVFRVTGVLTVIAGWFITAGIAFVCCFTVCLIMYFGKLPAIILLMALTIAVVIRSQKRFHKHQLEKQHGDVLFYEMMHCQDRDEVLRMLRKHIAVSTAEQIKSDSQALLELTDGLARENLHDIRSTKQRLHSQKAELKNLRRRETICLKRSRPEEVIRLSTPFHLIHNSLGQLRYGLLRIADPVLEHVDNHFSPVPPDLLAEYIPLRDRLVELCAVMAEQLKSLLPSRREQILAECDEIVKRIQDFRQHLVTAELQSSDGDYTSTALLLHIAEETQQYALQLQELYTNCQDFQG